MKDEFAAEAGNVKKRAFRDIQKLSRSFLGLLLIADDLGEIGDIEEARAKAQADLDTATAELAQRRADIEALKRGQLELEAAIGEAIGQRRNELRQAESAVADARNTAEQTIRNADADVTRRLEAAATEALGILAGGREAATVIVSEAEVLAKRREDEADLLVTERRETLATLDRDIAAGEAKLANIRAAIAKYAAE